MHDESKDFADQGSNFQVRLLRAFLYEPTFTARIHGVLKQEYFTGFYGDIFSHIRRYEEEHGSVPDIADLEGFISSSKEVDPMRMPQVKEAIRDIRNVRDTETQWAKTHAIEFCKRQEFYHALMKATTEWEKGNYHTIYHMVEEALKVGEDKIDGLDYFDLTNFEQRVGSMMRYPIPTGFKAVDEKLNGGLSRGELGVVVAGTGLGKTWTLCNIGAEAVRQGKNVIHYTLELHDRDVSLRYDSILTGVPIKNVIGESANVRQKLANMRNGHSNKLIIKEFDTRSKSVFDLKNHLKARRTKASFVPDLVIVDYADLLRPFHKYDQRRFELESIYEDLRSLAGEFAVPLWTASQGNRSSFMYDGVVQLNQISEAFAKAMVADVVLTLQRNPEDREDSAGNFYLAKNRAGEDGYVMRAYFDPGTFKMTTIGPPIPHYKWQAETNEKKQEAREYGGEKYRRFKERKNGSQDNTEQDAF